jgi:aldehyde dehydrogenase (NAD+)
LAASVFGDPVWARRVAEKLNVGHVSINDLIFPTADPRVPFGGCGSSGFGVTRGAEGLLAMTRPKVLARHRGGFYPHVQKRKTSDYAMLLGWLRFGHRRRWWN